MDIFIDWGSTNFHAFLVRAGEVLDRHEVAGLGLARPAGPMAGRAPVPRAGHPGGPQEPVDGGATHGEPVLGLEFLREMRGVEARIQAAGQREDLLLHGGGQTAARGPAPVAVHAALAPVRPEAGQQPPDLPLGQAQTHGRLGPGEAVFED